MYKADKNANNSQAFYPIQANKLLAFPPTVNPSGAFGGTTANTNDYISL